MPEAVIITSYIKIKTEVLILSLNRTYVPFNCYGSWYKAKSFTVLFKIDMKKNEYCSFS